MSSRHKTPIDLSDDDAFTPNTASNAPSSSATNAFGRMMAASIAATTSSEAPFHPIARLRDTCRRPAIIYNNKYNPMQAPPKELDPKYSPFVHGEPLFDDRPIISARIPAGHGIADPARRPRSH
jgi:hypothetical protein